MRARPRRPRREESDSAPTFAVVAAFEMKKVRQQGTFKHRPQQVHHRQPDAALRREHRRPAAAEGDAAHFRQVNLDDPLYRQREIVGVRGRPERAGLRPVHQLRHRADAQDPRRAAKSPTTRCASTATTSTREGNAFKLLYGWKGGQRPATVDGLRVPDSLELLRRQDGGGSVAEGVRSARSTWRRPTSAAHVELEADAETRRPGRGALDHGQGLLRPRRRGAGQAGDAERGQAAALGAGRVHAPGRTRSTTRTRSPGASRATALSHRVARRPAMPSSSSTSFRRSRGNPPCYSLTRQSAQPSLGWWSP